MNITVSMDELKELIRQEVERQLAESSASTNCAQKEEAKRPVGRPSKSCFADKDDSEEYREQMRQAVRKLKEKHYDVQAKCYVVQNNNISEVRFSALLCKKYTSPSCNKCDFVRFLEEVGICVDYRQFMKEMNRKKKNNGH